MKPTIQRSTHEQLYGLSLRTAIHDPKYTFLVFLAGRRRLWFLENSQNGESSRNRAG